jgi:hypothetical protein
MSVLERTSNLFGQKTKCMLWNGPVHGLGDDLIRCSVHISGVDDTVSCGISRLNTPKQTVHMNFDIRAWKEDEYWEDF